MIEYHMDCTNFNLCLVRRILTWLVKKNMFLSAVLLSRKLL